MAKGKSKRALANIGVGLLGLVIGGYLGEILAKIKVFEFLNWGVNCALASPVAVDLGVISFSLSLALRISIMSIVGLVSAILIYRRF